MPIRKRQPSTQAPANLSKNSTNYNNENLLDIQGNPELAQTYFAEFMRLYEHYRGCAIWDMGGTRRSSRSGATGSRRAFTLKTTRDGWVKQAYKQGSLDELARASLAGGQEPAA
jgi:hypothetical protein